MDTRDVAASTRRIVSMALVAELSAPNDFVYCRDGGWIFFALVLQAFSFPTPLFYDRYLRTWDT